MSTNLTQIVVETIEESKRVLGDGFDFAKEQTPLLIREFLAWRFCEHLVYAVIFIAVAVVAWVWLAKVIKNGASWWSEWDVLAGLLALFLLILAVCASTSAVRHSLQAIKIKVAPRVYLVEFAASQSLGGSRLGN